MGLVLPKEWKEPPNTEKVGFPGKVVSLEKRKEPPGKEEVGLPGKGSFSYGETAAGDDDAVEHWMQHRKEKRMGVPWAV